MPDMPELREFVDLAVKNQRVTREIEILKFQYPVAELKKLIGDPNWDRFRSMVQAKANDLEQSLENAQSILNDPRNLSPDALLRAKITILVIKAQLDAFTTVIDLPGLMIKDVAKAEKMLEDVKTGVEENSPTHNKGVKNGR